MPQVQRERSTFGITVLSGQQNMQRKEHGMDRVEMAGKANIFTEKSERHRTGTVQAVSDEQGCLLA